MKRTSLAALALVTALACAAAGCNAQPKPAPETAQDRAFGQKVRAYLLRHPEVLGEAMEKLQADQDALKQANASAAILVHRQALERDSRDGIAGNPVGAVTVVEFFDYRCPFCKAAEPEVQRLLARHKEVRLVLKEFPILDAEDQTHVSEDASRAALAAKAQGKYLPVHDALLAEKRLDEDAIKRILLAQGVDVAKDQVAAHTKSIADQLTDTHTLAHELGIDGTPAFIGGDKMIAGAQMSDLEAAIEAAAGKT